MSEAPDHSGHRERLRSRLLESGADALADHELLEYLLMLAIPRKDTKPIAKRLLKEFGGLGGVLSADPQALVRVDNVKETTAAAIKIAQALALRIHRQKAREGDILSNWQAVLDYLRADMAHHGKERVRALFLDARNIAGKKAVGDISAAITATPTSVIFNPIERRAVFGGIRARF